MSTSRLVLVAALATAVLLPARAGAQSSLGGQRAGTSSGTFLRIGVGARAVGLGETFVAVANDPSAIYWNPAGLASMQRREVAATHVDWPAEVDYEHVVVVLPWSRVGGSLALQFGVLSAEMAETTELQPFGTGRTFAYSDVVVGAAYARRWTDKLLVGVGAKYVREDLGSQVGGPTMGAVLYDMGSIFYLGLGSVRIATSLSNFGSALRPSGTWVSPLTGETREYDGFDPPLMFRYGVALEPLESATQRLTTSFEVNQPADNEQLFKAGAEWSWRRTLALRTGYNFRADELKFSGGAGFTGRLGNSKGTVDYAFTDGGFLGAIHRVTLGVQF
jgi:hypothetical protein